MANDNNGAWIGRNWKLLTSIAGVLIAAGALYATMNNTVKQVEKLDERVDVNNNRLTCVEKDISYIQKDVSEINRKQDRTDRKIDNLITVQQEVLKELKQ